MSLLITLAVIGTFAASIGASLLISTRRAAELEASPVMDLVLDRT